MNDSHCLSRLHTLAMACMHPLVESSTCECEAATATAAGWQNDDGPFSPYCVEDYSALRGRTMRAV
jgi:hypothetical protein